MKKTIENAVLTATKAAYPVAVLTTQAAFLTDSELAEKIIADCKKAVDDYFRYAPAYCDDVTEKATDEFFYRFAWDYVKNKKSLREFMRRSPAWNEDLQAWVINGNRTHNPDKDLIHKTAVELFKPALDFDYGSDIANNYNCGRILRALDWFSDSEDEDAGKILTELAPKANLRQKKSKVFIALCKALGIWQDSGEFQVKFSALCNEFNAKKINFKLIVSINPAHFLTMSNPHGRDGKLTNGKKETMVSCHSLDSSGCYRNGAIGYARDAVTMIAFTVKDFNDKETLNYRKTSRQLFMYEVGNGVLLQSRLYDSEISGESYGGVEGNADDIEKYKIYRELIEREIAECEKFLNFGKKFHGRSVGIVPELRRRNKLQWHFDL